jgi:hypothetical protein
MLLGQMFEEVPQILDTCLQRGELFAVLQDPPDDVLTLRLFLAFRELASLFRSLTAVQLLHFTNNFFLPGEHARA